MRKAPLTTQLFILLFVLAFPTFGQADNFTIGNGQVVTTTQELFGTETGTVEQGGAINTTGNLLSGIRGRNGANITAINAGTVTTAGNNSIGIILNNSNMSSISNSGTVATAGDNSGGLFNVGQIGTNITNSGSVTTAGNLSRGIQVIGADSVVTNSGTVRTSGTQSAGIFSGIPSIGFFNTGTSSSITNSGTVETTGDRSSGISSTGQTIINTKDGTITTRGNNSSGIDSVLRPSPTITNNGTIKTYGRESHGIASVNSNPVITNSGIIETSEALSHGITNHPFGIKESNATITNSGRITAKGAATHAILTMGGNDTLNILSGSEIQGRIDLGGGTNTINIISGGRGGPSSTLSFLGNNTINLSGNNIVNANGVVQVVDPTGQSVSGAVLGSFTAGLHSTILQRTTHTHSSKPIQLASTRLEAGMLSDSRAPQIWISGFGAGRERGPDGQVLGYDHNYFGVSGGYERQISSYRVGLMGGYAYSDMETKNISVQTKANSFFLGGYGQRSFGWLNLSMALLGGYEDTSNDRRVIDNLNGIESATANLDNFFLSPSVTLDTAIDLGSKVQLRPLASLIYSVSWQDDYTEAGTTRSNLMVNDRTVQALIGRVQLGIGYEFDQGTEFELRAGGRSRYTDNDSVTASLAGTSFRYATVGDDTVLGAYVGGNFDLALTDRLNVNTDIEYGAMEGSETYILGQMALEFVF